MKILSYVILLLSITALCFGSSNSKNENKLFGMTKSEITSDVLKVSETSNIGQIGSTITWGTNVIGYMALEDDGNPEYRLYAETEASWGTGSNYLLRDRYSPDLLEVQVSTGGQGIIGYSSRSDGGWLVYVEVATSLGLGNFSGTHTATLNGTPYTCYTSL